MGVALQEVAARDSSNTFYRNWTCSESWSDEYDEGDDGDCDGYGDDDDGGDGDDDGDDDDDDDEDLSKIFIGTEHAENVSDGVDHKNDQYHHLPQDHVGRWDCVGW